MEAATQPASAHDALGSAPQDAARERRIAELAAAEPELHLLLLYGSRARGEARPESDWDLGYLAGPGFDADRFFTAVAVALRTDRIDLVPLKGASGLLRYRAARDGRVLHEGRPGSYERFWLDSVHFWCDAGPLLKEGYEAALARLG